MSNKEIEISSEKSFGVVFSIIFFLIAFYPLFNSEDIHIWALILSIIFLFFAFKAPKILIIPNKVWFKFGLLLGSIIAPIIMSIVFFVTVTPVGIIMRIFGKDLLNQKFNKSTKSYWTERQEPVGPMKNQY